MVPLFLPEVYHAIDSVVIWLIHMYTLTWSLLIQIITAQPLHTQLGKVGPTRQSGCVNTITSNPWPSSNNATNKGYNSKILTPLYHIIKFCQSIRKTVQELTPLFPGVKLLVRFDKRIKLHYPNACKYTNDGLGLHLGLIMSAAAQECKFSPLLVIAWFIPAGWIALF